jgi:hypothetical protein
MEQVRLNQSQIEEFYVDVFAENQVEHFIKVIRTQHALMKKWIVDVGGGCGYFANLLNSKTGLPVRVIDSDEFSINAVLKIQNASVSGVLGDALNPDIHGDESVVCFNLILHHLIGNNEEETRALQKKALMVWRDKVEYLFVNEYIYDSWVGNISGRVIFEITKSKTLSAIGRFVSRWVPTLRANTFGVGVRFRSSAEWIKLFQECGFSVKAKVANTPEHISLPRRMLLIKEVRRDSFLLQ